MYPKFYTIETEITLKAKYLDNHLFKEVRGSWPLIVMLYIFLIIYTVTSITEEKLIIRICSILVYGYLILPDLILAYRHLFILSHKTGINYIEIVSISKKDLPNNAETEVVLTLKNKRKRVYIFRTAENVVEGFINELKLRNESIVLH